MKNHYIVKRISKKQNRKNIMNFLKDMAVFGLALIVSFIISVLTWT